MRKARRPCFPPKQRESSWRGLFLRTRSSPRWKGGQFDAVIVMYHDQGHIPMKLLGFQYDEATGRWDTLAGVNVTLGLPIVRTSVDHGTAFDKAGEGRANPQSMVEAIKMAAALSAAERLTPSLYRSSRPSRLTRCEQRPCSQVAQKRSDTRRTKYRGVRRTFQYVAATRGEGNAEWAFFSNPLESSQSTASTGRRHQPPIAVQQRTFLQPYLFRRTPLFPPLIKHLGRHFQLQTAGRDVDGDAVPFLD